MGGGRVDILSINLGALKLLPKAEYLDWSVQRQQENLIRLRVTATEGSVSVEKCYGSISLADNEMGKELIDHCDKNSIATGLLKSP